LDPPNLAANYSDRMVDIYPFRNGNGRMCHLVLNVILMRYAKEPLSGEKRKPPGLAESRNQLLSRRMSEWSGLSSAAR